MITCSECIQRMKPDHPQVRSGRYMRCGCDYCDKPSYYRELEREREEIKPIFKPRPIDNEVDQLKSGYIHLQKKVYALTDKKMVDKHKKYIYK